MSHLKYISKTKMLKSNGNICVNVINEIKIYFPISFDQKSFANENVHIK